MTGQQVINAVSQDVRSVLGTSGTSQTILMDYTSRIQQDILHTSFYKALNLASATVNTLSGTPNYSLGVSGIRRVINVYDRTRNRMLSPFKEVNAPLPQLSDPNGSNQFPPENQVSPVVDKRLKTQTGMPEYYIMIGGSIYFYPTPLQALSIEVQYSQQVAVVTDPAATLTVPDDAKDMMVAGVNYLANLFLARMDDAKFWGELYGMLKKGEQD